LNSGIAERMRQSMEKYYIFLVVWKNFRLMNAWNCRTSINFTTIKIKQ